MSNKLHRSGNVWLSSLFQMRYQNQGTFIANIIPLSFRHSSRHLRQSFSRDRSCCPSNSWRRAIPCELIPWMDTFHCAFFHFTKTKNNDLPSEKRRSVLCEVQEQENWILGYPHFIEFVGDGHSTKMRASVSFHSSVLRGHSPSEFLPRKCM